MTILAGLKKLKELKKVETGVIVITLTKPGLLNHKILQSGIIGFLFHYLVVQIAISHICRRIPKSLNRVGIKN